MIGYFSIDLKAAEKRTTHLKNQFLSKQKTVQTELNINIDRANKLSSINPDLLKKLRNFVVQNINYNWSEMSEEVSKKLNLVRQRDSRDPRSKINHSFIVVIPKYVWDDRRNRYV